MKRAAQTIIIAIGFIAAICGISRMAAETATMIIPAWLLIFVVVVAIGTLSLALGFMIKFFTRSGWHTMTFTSIIVTIVVVSYVITDRLPGLRIIVPQGYTGEVDLLVSRDTVRAADIPVNNSGIGYITEMDYDIGFDPRIIQGGLNISGRIKDWGKGQATNFRPASYYVRFVSFVIPGPANDPLADLDKKVRAGAIDTMRLQRLK